MASTDFKTDLALLIFNNTDIAAIGDAAGIQNSATAGNLYVALHTADPGAGGKQNTSECAFGLYARQPVARASGAGGWTCTAGAVANASAITFAEANGGTEHVTHFSVGYEISGATKMIASAELTTHRDVAAGVTLSFAAGELDITIT
jgi:hypothetical protein